MLKFFSFLNSSFSLNFPSSISPLWDITKIFVNDNEVTFDGDLADNVQRDVASSDSNYFRDSASLIKIEPHFGSDSQTASSLLL